MQKNSVIMFINSFILLLAWQVVWAEEEFKGPKQIVPDAPSKEFHISYTYRAGGQGQPQPLVNGSILHSGDHYKLTFIPPTKRYVYLLQSDSSERIYCLFPMKSFKGVTVNNFNPVAAGKTYFIPASNQSFQLDNQVGTEKIYLVDSPQEDKVLENFCSQADTGFSLAQLDIHVKTRGLAGIVPDSTSKNIMITYEDENFSVLQSYLNCQSPSHAQAVKDFLVQTYQIPDKQLIIEAYGEGQPIASNETESGRQLNRRVDFVRID